MGWWPFSSSPDTTSSQPPPTTTSITTTTTTIPTSITTSTSTPTLPPPPPSNPQTSSPDSDFHAAFPHLAPASPSPSTTTTPTSSPASAPPTTLDPSLPTTMSCRAAFDSAFYCSSFGGHFNDIYRYGTLRSCSEHWADWRFCMSLKTHTQAARVELIQDRYRGKEDKIREGRSCEDVWERRKTGEEVRGAFGGR